MPYVSKAGVVQQRTHLGGERFRLVREATSVISPADNTITVTQLPTKGNQFG